MEWKWNNWLIINENILIDWSSLVDRLISSSIRWMLASVVEFDADWCIGGLIQMDAWIDWMISIPVWACIGNEHWSWLTYVFHVLIDRVFLRTIDLSHVIDFYIYMFLQFISFARVLLFFHKYLVGCLIEYFVFEENCWFSLFYTNNALSIHGRTHTIDTAGIGPFNNLRQFE